MRPLPQNGRVMLTLFSPQYVLLSPVDVLARLGLDRGVGGPDRCTWWNNHDVPIILDTQKGIGVAFSLGSPNLLGEAVNHEIAVRLHDAIVNRLALSLGAPKRPTTSRTVVKDEIAISLQDQLIAAVIRYDIVVWIESPPRGQSACKSHDIPPLLNKNVYRTIALLPCL
jgi:hypothetical protein